MDNMITPEQLQPLTRLVVEFVCDVYIRIDDLCMRIDSDYAFGDPPHVTVRISNADGTEFDLSEVIKTHQLFLETEDKTERYKLDDSLSLKGDLDDLRLRLVAEPPLPVPPTVYS